MTTPAQIHIMLVSEQAAPNLLPALDPALKPQQAVLLVSHKMSQLEAQKDLHCTLTAQQNKMHDLANLLRKFEQAKVLVLQGNQVQFPTEEARQFANGGWNAGHLPPLARFRKTLGTGAESQSGSRP